MDSYLAIGMNGNTLVSCGTATPIVQRASDSAFCRFVIGEKPLEWHPASYFQDLLCEARVTKFAKPIPIMLDATPLTVIFLTHQFRDITGCGKPPLLEDTPCIWTNVQEADQRTIATCVPELIAQSWLDAHAKIILQKINRMITGPKETLDIQREAVLERANMALCATTDKSLRFQLYVRYGAMLAPETAQHTFDMFVSREFKLCSWEYFKAKVATLVETMRSRPVPVR